MTLGQTPKGVGQVMVGSAEAGLDPIHESHPRVGRSVGQLYEPDEDGEGECYCPNCGVLLTDENCLKAEDLDSLPPKPRPTLLGVLVGHLAAVRSK
jgi:hypothetical protein